MHIRSPIIVSLTIPSSLPQEVHCYQRQGHRDWLQVASAEGLGVRETCSI